MLSRTLFKSAECNIGRLDKGFKGFTLAFLVLCFVMIGAQPAYATSLPSFIAPTSYVFALIGLLSVYVWLYRVSTRKEDETSPSKIINDNAFSYGMIVPVYLLLLKWDEIAVEYVIYGKSATYIESFVQKLSIMLVYILAIYVAIILFNVFIAFLKKYRFSNIGARFLHAMQRSSFPIFVCVAAFTLSIQASGIFILCTNVIAGGFIILPFFIIQALNRQRQRGVRPIKYSSLWFAYLPLTVVVFFYTFSSMLFSMVYSYGPDVDSSVLMSVEFYTEPTLPDEGCSD